MTKHRFEDVKTWLVGCCVLGALALPAPAAQITAKFVGANPSLGLDLTLDPSPAGGTQWNWNGVQTGQYNWQRTDSGSSGGIGQNFWTFCIELTQHISNNGIYTYDIANLDAAPLPGTGSGSNTGMGAAKAELVRELFGRYYTALDDNALNPTAFQLAVWEIVFDNVSNPLNVSATNGEFYVRNVDSSNETYVVNTANTWLASLNGTGPKASGIIALTNPDRQDQITYVPPPPSGDEPSPAPEPGSLILAGVGIFGAALARRRRQARSAA